MSSSLLDDLNFISTQVPCQTQTTKLGLFLSLYLQPRLVSSGFYGKEFLWSGQKLTAPRELRSNLSLSPKVISFNLMGILVREPAISHVWI